MRTKEECRWCMSTQHIERKISPQMPEEFKFRCSACHEMWAEEYRDCDFCGNLVESDSSDYTVDRDTGTTKCNVCHSLGKDKLIT
jgi:hypothetical protein